MSEALGTLHWQVLKKMMEDAGMAWKDKADAIEKLGGLVAKETAPAEPEPVEPVAPKAKAEVEAPRFNSKQPYGEICGDIPDARGARFLQGGLYFNNAGVVVGKA
jgi:hypothetical protein